MKKLLKWIFGAFALMLFVLGIIIANNFNLLKRALTYPSEAEVTNSSWYQPKTLIKGSNTSNFSLTHTLSINKSVLEDISSYAEQRNSNALLVLHKGELQLEKNWRGSTQESTTNSFSMAKTVIGVLIGIAIDEGYIKNEKEFVATYITEWAKDERSTITIEDLLLMQSGLRNNWSETNIFSDHLQMYLGKNVERTALEVPLEKKPSTVFEYNNVNTQILGILLERVTGEAIETYASNKLWQPMGASDAAWWLDRKNGMPKVYCGIFARATDWTRLGQLILQDGKWNNEQIIPKHWLKKMLRASKLNKNYGYQIWLIKEAGPHQEEGEEPFLAKCYSIEGAHIQNVFIVPEYELVITRIGEKPESWDDSYLVNRVVASLME